MGTERQIGMGLGPIPLSAIRQYAIDWSLDDEECDIFHRLIRKMDNKFLELTSSSKNKPQDGNLVAPVDDLERSRAVMDVIKARAAAANKKHRKQKVH